jgi:23S rRNA (guanosine2251-2'-O)-methyltransferase
MEARTSDEDLVYGLHPVASYVAEAAGRIREVLVDAGAGGGPRDVAEAARVAGVAVRVLPAEAFRELARGRPFQGIAARVKPFEYADADDMARDYVQDPGSVLIALDSVQDPHNLGSILRSAAFFGARGIVLPRDRSVEVTPVVVKVSAGAAARVPVAQVTNLARWLRSSADAGWTVVGAVARGGILPSALPASRPLILVLGSEGEGLRRLVTEACSVHVTILSPGGFESLNVGVAAGILLAAASEDQGRIQ